jgi:hypothetical protein
VVAASHGVYPHAYDMVKLLLDNGAAQDIMNKMGKIPIMLVNLNDPESQRIKSFAFGRQFKVYRVRFYVPQVLALAGQRCAIIQQELEERLKRK